MVHHVQFQTALAAVVFGGAAAFQLVLPAGHHQQPQIGPPQDAVKKGHLHVGFQRNFLLAGQVAVGGVGKRPHPRVPLLQRLQAGRPLPDVVQRGTVGGQPGAQRLQRPGGLRLLRQQAFPAGLLGGGVDFLALRQQGGQLLDGGVDAQQLGAAGVAGILGGLAGCVQLLHGLPGLLLGSLGGRRIGKLQPRPQGVQLGGQLGPAAVQPRQLFPVGGQSGVQRLHRLLLPGHQNGQLLPPAQPLLRLCALLCQRVQRGLHVGQRTGQLCQLAARQSIRHLAHKARMQRFPLAPQPALRRQRLAALPGQRLPLLLPGFKGSFPLLNGLSQRLPPGNAFVQLRQRRVQLRQRPGGVLPAPGQLFGGGVGGWVGRVGGHALQQLALPLLKGGSGPPRRKAFFHGLTAGVLQRLPGGVQFRLGGGGAGHLRRGGVMHRAAHRAGRALLQGLRQNPRLLVQKCLILLPEVLPQPGAPLHGAAIRCQRRVGGAPGLFALRQLGLQVGQRRVIGTGLPQLAAQLFPPGLQPLLGVPLRPEGLQGGGLAAQSFLQRFLLAGQCRALGLPLLQGAAQLFPLRRVLLQGQQRLTAALGADGFGAQTFFFALRTGQCGGLPPPVLQRGLFGGALLLPGGKAGGGLCPLFFQRRQGVLPLAQLRVAGKLRLPCVQLLLQRLPFGRVGQPCLQRRPVRHDLGTQRLPLLAGLRQPGAGLFQLLRLAQQRRHLVQLAFQRRHRLLAVRLGLLVGGNELLHQLQRFAKGQRPLFGQRQAGVVPLHAANVLLRAGLLRLTAALQPAGFPFQPLLQHHIIPGLEDFPKNFLPAFGVRQQQLEKIPLRDHGDLGKLAPVQPKDGDDLGGHLAGFGHYPAGQMQLRLGLLHRGAAAAAGGAQVFRAAAHRVAPAAAKKFQLHKGGGLRQRVLGAEHGGVPVVAAGLAVQGVGDGVKDGGLACAGVPRDEVQPPGAQLFHGKADRPGVGAKGGKRQFQRSHSSPSQMVSMSARAKSCWSALMGWPFCRL